MRIRLLATIVLACVVAACAGSKPARSPGAALSHQSMLARAPILSDDETIDYLSDAAVARFEEICGSRRGMADQLACLRESLLRGFDSTGEAARNCDASADIEPTLRCIITGTIGYELARRENLDAANDYNWDDGRVGLRSTVRQLRAKVVSDCATSGGADINACVLSRTGQAFALADSQVTLCSRADNMEFSIGCLLRSFMLQSIGGSIARMAVDDGQSI